ncbi:MAG: protein phosphatase 2C domain-containing protein [Planctomycetaceae bacterium]
METTDDFQAGLSTLENQPWGKKSVRLAIGIGFDADLDVLQQFIGTPEIKPMTANNPDTLVVHIRWVSTAILESVSAPASQVEGRTGKLHVALPSAPQFTYGGKLTQWDQSEPNGWKIIVDSVRGPTHVRTGLPNQDDFDYASGPPITIAVSDGHGSSNAFRSDRGAGFATETAIEVAESFFEGEWERLSLQDRQQQLDVRLPNRIVSEWRAKVRRNLKTFLSKDEQEMP